MHKYWKHINERLHVNNQPSWVELNVIGFSHFSFIQHAFFVLPLLLIN